MKHKQLFIFDVDGTLVDAYHAIQKSLNFTLKKYGYPEAGFEEAKRAVGKGDRKFIGAFVKPEEAEAALRTFKKHHQTAVLHHCRILPYGRLTLHRLRQKGKRVAIATNRPRKFTHLILKGLDLKKYFDYVLCADEIESLKPDPKILHTITERFRIPKREAVFVGDMDIDMETAHRAGIDGIYVKGGSSPLSAVRKYKNKRVISSLKDILSFL